MQIRVVLFEQEGRWIAQCLEVDLAAQAKKFNDLRYELERVLVGHMVICDENGEEPFEHLPTAPAHYWKMFDEARAYVQFDEVPFGGPHPAFHPKPLKRELRVA